MMFSYLAAPGFQLFSVAALVLIGLLGVELVGMLFGHSISGLLDTLLPLHGPELGGDLDHGTGLEMHGPDAHSEGVFGTVYDWINAGRVPLLILIMAALGSFAVIGLALQIVATHLLTTLPTPLAAVIAFAAAIPCTRWVSRGVSQIVPRDESYAISQADLVGRTGIVTLGPVEADSAGRAKIQDRFGNWHFPRVRAAKPGLVIQQGVTILVVDRVQNELSVVPAEGRLAGS